jgi:hypothetical protein
MHFYTPIFVDRFERQIFPAEGNCKIMLDPFSVTRNFPNQRTDVFTTDAEGCRTTLLRQGLPKLTITGGSSAFGAGLGADSDAFAWQLSELLPQYQCLNGAVTGHQSGEELSVLVHQFCGTGIRAHVSFTGFNDTLGGWFGRRRENCRLAFQGLVYALEHQNHGYYCLSREGGPILPQKIPPPEEKTEQYFDLICQAFQDNLYKMHLIAKGEQARFIAVFQPEMSFKKRLADSEAAILANYYQRFSATAEEFGYRYREQIARATEFCKRKGIESIDMNQSPAFVSCEKELFYDPCHLNVLGHRIVAQTLAEHIAD